MKSNSRRKSACPACWSWKPSLYLCRNAGSFAPRLLSVRGDVCLCTPNYDIQGIPISAACRLSLTPKAHRFSISKQKTCCRRHFTEKTAVMAHFVQSRLPLERPKKSHLSCHARRNFPSLHSRRREGIRRKGKGERNWGERVGGACYNNPLLFISADAGVRKFQIGWAVMSNLLACILACINERQTWCRHQENVFFWHKLWKIQITPIM